MITLKCPDCGNTAKVISVSRTKSGKPIAFCWRKNIHAKPKNERMAEVSR